MPIGNDLQAHDRGLVSSLDRMLAEALHLVAATKGYLETRSALPAMSAANLSHLSEFERIATRLGYVVA